jgi:hypothetical protein
LHSFPNFQLFLFIIFLTIFYAISVISSCKPPSKLSASSSALSLL